MKQILIYLLVFLYFCSISHAQNGGIANNWFLGYFAGINFDTGSPISIGGPINTSEGCAVISDINGNLLFSTDGRYVYNRNNIQMPSGNGLSGHRSSTQSGVIIPDPGNVNQYYIFTAAAQAGDFGGYDGIAYSIVDMNLNGGFGDVTVRNVRLVHPAAEKLTAVRHCNGTDYWMICHGWNSDAFYAYQVTATGINAPIVSHVGSFYQTFTGDNREAIGYLKSSPNGKRLAAAISCLPNNNIELFDFDNAAGLISNPIYIPTTGGAYGVSFSPDNTKLFVGFQTDGGTFSGGLRQYNLSAGNAVYTIATAAGATDIYGAIQLGPDGKIYVAKYNTYGLSIINNPNIFGIGCNYVQQGLSLNDRIIWGLPNFPDNLITPNFSLGADDTLCDNIAILDVGSGWNSYTWSTGATSQSINVNQSGQYWVEVVTNCGNVLKDTINVYIFTPNGNSIIGDDTSICNGSSIILNAGGGASYLWSTGAVSQTLTINTPGTYWIQKEISCGIVTDTIRIYNFPPDFPIDIGNDTALCDGVIITLDALAGGISYLWSTGDTTQAIEVDATGTYWVQKITPCSTFSDTIHIHYNPPILASLSFTTDMCLTTITVTAAGGTGNLQYSLNGGAYQNSPVFIVGGGSYYVTIKDDLGCIYTTETLTPVIAGIGNTSTIACYNGNTTLVVTIIGGQSPYQYSLNGGAFQGTNSFNVSAGTYTITIEDANNCIDTTTLVVTEPLPIVIQPLQIDSAYCYGANGQASVIAMGGNGGFTYTWFTSPRQYNDTLQGVATGTYKVVVKDEKGCTKDTNLFIANTPPPIANYISRPDNAFLSIYENDNIQFYPNTYGVYTYSWDFGDGTFSTEQNPIHNFAKPGDYFVTLTVFDEHKACPDIYTLRYHIISPCSTIYIPDAFSPNGDGFNDVFFFVGNVQNFQATIFDRWGKEVKRLTAISDTWDGKNMPEGVYNYVLKAVCEDGNALKRGGTITLIR